MVYDVARVRGLYTSLSDGWTYLNAHEYPQIPERVASAVSRGFRASATIPRPTEEYYGGLHAVGVPRRDDHPLRPQAEGMLSSARQAIADLTDTSPDAVVLGTSWRQLAAELVRALQPLLRRGSSAVLSRADAHPLPLDGDVRWAEPDLGTGQVPSWQYPELLTGATRLVALQAADPQVGAMNNTLRIADHVRAVSRAWVLVDATAIAPYRSVKLEDLGADIVAIDCAALGVAGVAALAFRDPTMFPRLDAAELSDQAPPALAAGVAAAVDHLASLDEDAAGTRKHRLALGAVGREGYASALDGYLVESLQSMSRVHVFGVTGELAADADVERIPHVTFSIKGVPAATVYQRLITNGMVTSIAEPTPLLLAMGLEDTRGAVTCSMGMFNTPSDVDQLIRVIASLG